MPRAIYIDAKNRTITYATTTGLASMQRAVEGPIESTPLAPPGHMLLVNEEGLLHPERQYGFVLRVGAQRLPLRGCGLLLGATNSAGDSTSVRLTCAEVGAMVSWTL